MRLRLGNMRKAFVLPMSLVATFIAMIIVIAIIWLYDRKHGRIMGKEITI